MLRRRRRPSDNVGLELMQLWRMMLMMRRIPSSYVGQELLLLWRIMRRRVMRRQQHF
jgi:hypothetical protein